jgi:hypothetical protein
MKLFNVLLILMALCQIAFSQTIKGLTFKMDLSFTKNAAFRWAIEPYPDVKFAKAANCKNITMEKNVNYTSNGRKELFMDIFLPLKMVFASSRFNR